MGVLVLRFPQELVLKITEKIPKLTVVINGKFSHFLMAENIHGFFTGVITSPKEVDKNGPYYNWW